MHGLAARAAAALAHPDGTAILANRPPGVPPPLPMLPSPHPLLPWISLAVALWVAGFDLGRVHLPRWIQAAGGVADPIFALLRVVHSGLIGDYVTWMVVGLAILSVGAVLLG